MKDQPLSRRGFAVGSLQTAAALAATALLRTTARGATTEKPAPKMAGGRMRVTLDSTSPTEKRLRYMKQIGVEDVELNMMYIPEYMQHRRLEPDVLLALKTRVESHGMRLGSIYLDQSTLQNFLLGRPGGEQELDNVCHAIESIGQAGIPLFLFSLLASRAVLTATHGKLPGYYNHPGGRGGSTLRAWDDARATKDAPCGEIPVEQTWARLKRFLEATVPVAEKAHVVMGCHPSDPPVERYWGVHQADYTFAAIKRYTELVPSPNNCLLLCQGTIQEAGIDVLEYIRYFGPRGKIAQVELRGVRGTVPKYDETFMDDGDLNLVDVMKELKKVGWSGPVEVAHVPTFEDDPDDKAIYAWSVAYVKGMIAALA